MHAIIDYRTNWAYSETSIQSYDLSLTTCYATNQATATSIKSLYPITTICNSFATTIPADNTILETPSLAHAVYSRPNQLSSDTYYHPIH